MLLRKEAEEGEGDDGWGYDPDAEREMMENLFQK